MSHRTNAEIYRLATLLAQEAAFEREDMMAMLHVMDCSVCSEKLTSASAVVEAMDNIALVSMIKERAKATSAAKAKGQAIIRIVVLDTRVMLQQMESAAAKWLFEKPLGIGSKRSAGDEGRGVEKLEDPDNGKTFVSYDPVKQVLAIQIDAEDGKHPAAKIKTSDGDVRDIVFEKRGSVYWAEVHDLVQGEYELILEK